MTLDHVLRFALSDIRAIVCECKNAECRFRLSFAPSDLKKVDVLRKCPSCGKEWLLADTTRPEVPLHPVTRFLGSFNDAARNGDTVGCRLSFEMAAPEVLRRGDD